MLLSPEKPFVGAFALFIPRATRQRLTGLTLSSCRGRFGSCANGQLEFPRNLGSPRGNAPRDTDCIGGNDQAMVCAEALLKLALWCQQRHQSASGGVLCPPPRKTESPPALSATGSVCGVGAALYSSVADDTSRSSSKPESSRRSATTDAQDGSGGGV